MRLILASLTATLLATSAGAATFINGSFELSSPQAAPGQTFLPTGSTDITGWTVVGPGVDYTDSSVWDPSDGDWSVGLSTRPGGLTQRIFGLVPGKTYVIKFDLSADPFGTIPGDVGVLVSATNGPVSFYTYSKVVGLTPTNMLYATQSYIFTAAKASELFQIRSRGIDPNAPVVDNFTISLIPEPATWGLMIAGFGMIGLAARRRRITVAA